ncbi:MAG: twitching motility protein PilT [Candidatus Fischerbacteria bacterium RBG_13_37_8]|uniref:Twitching motility protein PilT n=1 Tax=Candidatus Fischerbacteria bacterium RBG_13_37_8 TaxID=1817863 RepID=A0A1F5VL86_9BACT|nr:MAG: twitching motility protein PilT [Candidatus Fischerbacteria bacterium RBG_13_37_8]
MNIIDSSGWLEYFADGPHAPFFADAITKSNPDDIIVPTIIIYEVFKKILDEKNEDIALQVIAQLKRFHVVPFDEDIALAAAKISESYKIPMADSIIYATAKKYDAWIWTKDDDFKNLPKVKYCDTK